MKIRKGRFSGTLGQEVYVNTKHGQVVRSRPRRPWRATDGRLAVQHNLVLVVRAWRQLTPKQHEAWAVAARKENMQTYPFFSKINGALAAAKLPLLMDPPKRENPRPNPVGELEILNQSGVIKLRLRVSRAPAPHTFVLASRWCSRGIWTRGNRFATIGELPAAAGGWSDITDLYVRAFGVPPVDHRVFIRTRQLLKRLGRWLQGDLGRRAAARASREIEELNRGNPGATLPHHWSGSIVARELQACCKPVAGLFEAFPPPLPVPQRRTSTLPPPSGEASRNDPAKDIDRRRAGEVTRFGTR